MRRIGLMKLLLVLLFIVSFSAVYAVDCNLDANYTQDGNNNTCNNIYLNGNIWNTSGYNLTVSDDVYVNGTGGILDASAGDLVTVGALMIEDGGSYYATPNITKITSEDNGSATYAIDNDGILINNNGTFNITTAASTNLDIVGSASSENIYNLIISTSATVSYEVDDTIIANDLTVNGGTFRASSNTNQNLNVTGNVVVNTGQLGRGSTSEANTMRFGNLTVASGATYYATSAETIISENFNTADGTYTYNSGVLNITGTGNLNVSNNQDFGNLSIGQSGQNVTLILPSATNYISIYGWMDIEGGTFVGSGGAYNIRVRGSSTIGSGDNYSQFSGVYWYSSADVPALITNNFVVRTTDVDLAGYLNVSGNLTIEASQELVSDGYDVYVYDSIINSGTLNLSTNLSNQTTLTFGDHNNSGFRASSGAFTATNLTIQGANTTVANRWLINRSTFSTFNLTYFSIRNGNSTGPEYINITNNTGDNTGYWSYANGENCYNASYCTSGHCVHEVCRAESTYCGDGHCDTGESCSADCDSSESTSISASGSGGGASSTVSTTKKTLRFFSVDADEQITGNIFSTRIFITKITAVASEASSAAEITVSNYDSKPKSVSDPGKEVYQYLNIGSTVGVKSVEINFTVGASWLKENGINSEDIVMLHYKNNAWVELPTVHISGESYSATTDSFSVFAISSKVATEKPKELVSEAKQEEPESVPEPEEELATFYARDISSNESNLYIYAFMVLLIGLLYVNFTVIKSSEPEF